MKIKTSELWYKFILLLFTVNVLLFTVPTLYLRLLDDFTVIVSVCFVLILIMKSRNLGKATIIGISVSSFFIIGFTLSQGKPISIILTILSSLVAYICFDRLQFSDGDKRFIQILCIIMWIFLFIKSFGYYEKFLFDSARYINSNTMGMVSLDLTMLLVYMIIISGNQSKNKWLLVLGILEFFVLNNYKARGCMVSFIFFCLAVIFRKYIFANKRRFMLVFVAIIIIGVLVPFVYMMLADSKALGAYTYASKDMYTRVGVWKNVVKYFLYNKNAFFAGFPTEIIELYGNRLHNTYFQLLVYVGGIGFFAYYFFVFRYIRGIIYSAGEKQGRYILVLAYCALLILGYTEVSMFWAVTYMMHYMFLGIASGN